MTSVKVAVRVRPLNKREVDMDSKFIIQMEGKKTTIVNTKMNEQNLEGVSESTREAMRVKEFTFDFSFWTVDKQEDRYCNQEQVYNCLGVDVVDSGYEGYNACVFAYGQTGSGKTYTMMGNPGDVGLIPRICQELFHRMTDETTSYRTEVSYLEIYNEKVRDLLKTTNHSHIVHNLRVREHPKEGPYVQGLSKYIVSSFEEIEALMQKGNSVRTTASTNMNDVSSRSHAIFTIVFTQATIKDGIPSEKTSKIHLVDLAGSERATATGATGQRLREGGSINKSLVSLGTVIKQLAEVSEKGARPGKGHFIPYRDSVLTWLLKDSLGGNSRTIMITTISPAEVNYAETLSALRYANRAKNIINRPTVNEDHNVKLIRELREEIERLKAMIGGDIDSITTPKVKERLHESEARMKVLTEEWSEKWKDIANILKEQGTLALRKEGLGVVLDSALPHLIGIDDDILSTGIMLFHLKEGKTRIGSSGATPPVDIIIAGQEVEKEHCVIENANSIVTLVPVDKACCFVNGNQVHEATKLTQGAVILLGKTNMFRYNNPAEAAQMKKELQKSGMTFSLSRTSLLSQSMTDLYRSSENLSTSNSWELEKSHREEQEKIEELRCQVKVLEEKYHAAEEDRINKQVCLEMELEKRQKLLDRACKDLEKVQLEVVQGHETGAITYKIPKGTQIDDLLKKLDEREYLLTETSRTTRETLLEKMEALRIDNEKNKDCIQDKLVTIEDKCRMKQTEIKLLQDELQMKKQAASDQDLEDQKVINEEKQLLTRMKEDFDILFRSKSRENESLRVQLDDLDKQAEDLKKQFEEKEVEMRDRWKTDVDAIAEENCVIEEAWNDLKGQEAEYAEQLESETISEKERNNIKQERDQLETAKQLLKVEEQKVASRERKILDAIEVEMDKWEQYKKQEETELKVQKLDLAKNVGSGDLNQLIGKIEGKERNVEDLLHEVVKQNSELAEFENSVSDKTTSLKCNIEDLEREKDELNNGQCQAVIKLEKDIIDINEELNKLDNKLCEDLKEIEEERQNLKILQEFQNSKGDSGTADLAQVQEKLKHLDLTEEERSKIEQRKKELEKLQAAVDKANEELEDKVKQFDEARDMELDTIDLEKVNLQERIRQDRINALVEQEVKRRMFEEKVYREQKRQLERDREKKEREEEIKRLKEAHFREIKQLKAKYERRSGQVGRTMTPSKSNPYVTVMSADSDGDVPRRKSTGYLMNHESAPISVHITIPFYRLQAYGSDSHYEYEVKIVIGDDVWSVMRRYKQFREFHLNLKNKYPQVGALVFPPKKFFSKTEKVAAERRQQLEFYMKSVIEICTQIPECVLHSSNNQFLSKQVLCDFDSFFRKGLFESSKYGTT